MELADEGDTNGNVPAAREDRAAAPVPRPPPAPRVLQPYLPRDDNAAEMNHGDALRQNVDPERLGDNIWYDITISV